MLMFPFKVANTKFIWDHFINLYCTKKLRDMVGGVPKNNKKISLIIKIQ